MENFDTNFTLEELKRPVNSVGNALIFSTLLQMAVVLILFFIMILVRFAVSIAASRYIDINVIIEMLTETEFLILASVVASIAGVFPFISLAKKTSMKAGSIFSGVRLHADYIKIGIVAVGVGSLVSYLSWIMQLLLNTFGYTMEYPSLLEPGNTVFMMIIQLFLTCVIAPFVEEYIYRGVVFGMLTRYSNRFAILVSAALFGIAHANFYQIFPAFIIGLFLAYLTLKTHSILPAVFVHMFNNIISMVQSYLLSMNAEYATIAAYGIDIVLILLGLFFLFNLKINVFNVDQEPRDYNIERKSKLVFTSASVMIFMIGSLILAVLSIKPA